MNLHEKLIDELLHGNVVRTEREEAARQEILKLRGVQKDEPQKGRRVKDEQPVSS